MIANLEDNVKSFMAGKERKHIAPSKDTYWTTQRWAVQVEGKNLDDTIMKVDEVFQEAIKKKKKDMFDF